MNAIGIDIGGTHLRAARVGPDGAILARARAASARDPALVEERIEALIAKVLDGTVAGIGIGVPGRVDFESRRVLSGGYVDLSGLDLAARLEARFGRRVVLDNDCGMALLGERAAGAARGRRHVVMLTIGTGIGGAILEDGRILRGRGTAGQLGHVCVDPAGLDCVCGKRGCVETVSSGTALGRHIREAGFPPATTAAELLERRAAGDPLAGAVLSAWAAPLRIAIDGLVAALDPELVVLGGGLGGAAAEALEALPAEACWYSSEIRPASLGDDAGVIGAAMAAYPSPAEAPAAPARTLEKLGTCAEAGAISALSVAAPPAPPSPTSMPSPPGLRPAAVPAPTPAGSVLLRSDPRKRVVFVNGVPASGKSSVAAAVSAALGWPLLSLDTVKNPFLAEIEGVDRPFNRKLGRASLSAIFALVGAAPPGGGFVLDAWFGFQPRDWLDGLIASAGIEAAAELWCTAPPETIGARYAARAASRLPGHPGADYAAELVALARTACPLALPALRVIDTTAPTDVPAILAWLAERWRA